MPDWVIVPGVAGATETTPTANVCGVELPQALFAVTEIVPPVDVAVAIMFEVVDVPLHPFGKVHV